MKTVGKYLKQKRRSRKLSLEEVEKKTKIKKSFLKAIEEEQWEKLPEYPVSLGFVKNLAVLFEIDSQKVAAFFRRDYPPRRLEINPKPDVSPGFAWSPRLTAFLFILVFLAVIAGYLGLEYFSFTKDPFLRVDVPRENEVVFKDMLVVKGEAEKDATVTVNGQPAFLEESGDFETQIEVSETLDEVTVKARSRSGQETVVVRKIRVDLME